MLRWSCRELSWWFEVIQNAFRRKRQERCSDGRVIIAVVGCQYRIRCSSSNSWSGSNGGWMVGNGRPGQVSSALVSFEELEVGE